MSLGLASRVWRRQTRAPPSRVVRLCGRPERRARRSWPPVLGGAHRAVSALSLDLRSSGQRKPPRQRSFCAGQRRRCCKDALLLSHLRRQGRLAGDQSKFRATSRAAPLLLRISRRPGRALLGTVECRAGRRIRQSPGASGHTKGCSQPEIALRTLGFPEKSRSFAALRMTT